LRFVAEGNACEDCALYCQQAGAVNKRVEAQHRSDVATLVRQFRSRLQVS
jgi:hypothetical protein